MHFQKSKFHNLQCASERMGTHERDSVHALGEMSAEMASTPSVGVEDRSSAAPQIVADQEQTTKVKGSGGEKEMSVKFGGVTTNTIPAAPPLSEAEVKQQVDNQLKTITEILEGMIF